MSVDERVRPHGAGIASDWPLFQLRLATDRLELRPPTDDEIAELARVARRGIHGDGVMPFANGWTRLIQSMSSAAGLRSTSGRNVPAGASMPGRCLSPSSSTPSRLGSSRSPPRLFPILRTVGTGSWLARVHQRRGIGSEMRAAVLHFAFTALDAEVAVTGAYSYNEGSIGVSRKLGYEANGTRRDIVRGAAADALLFRLAREQWFATARPDVTIDGFGACADLFGVGQPHN